MDSGFIKIFNDVAMIFIGLSMLIFAIKSIGGCVKSLVDAEKLEGFLKKYVSNKYVGFFVGFVCTAILQSAGAATMIIVSFANENILDVVSASAFILGSSLGTTVKAYFNYIGIGFLKHLGSFFMIISFVFALILLMSANKFAKDISKLFVILGLFFTGPKIVKTHLEMYAQIFKGAVQFLQNWPFIGFFISLFSSILLGAFLNSSSVLTAVIQTIVPTVGAKLYTVVPMIFGANVGVVIPTIFASLENNVNSRLAVTVKLLSRTLSAVPSIIVALILKNWLLKIDASGLNIAHVHFIFNALGFVFVPFLPYIINFLKNSSFFEFDEGSKEVKELVN